MASIEALVLGLKEGAGFGKVVVQSAPPGCDHAFVKQRPGDRTQHSPNGAAGGRECEIINRKLD
jgi:hypothetical protein